MGLIRATKRALNWLVNTPNGCLTFGLIYGATVTALWYKLYEQQEELVNRAYIDGIDYGLKIKKKHENGENIDVLVVKSGKMTRVLHARKDEKPCCDYGAEKAISCAENANSEAWESLRCNPENFMVQANPNPENVDKSVTDAQNT